MDGWNFAFLAICKATVQTAMAEHMIAREEESEPQGGVTQCQ